MAKKILSGVSVKVENRSGFDKSRLNLLSTFVGTITPIVKQLCIPGHVRYRADLHSILPPLAFDAYLRSHLKVEAFFVPMRLCYGGFESWFCGKEMYDSRTNSFVRAKLPRLAYNFTYDYDAADTIVPDEVGAAHGGACSLLDYLNVRFDLDESGLPSNNGTDWTANVGKSGIQAYYLNLFPVIAYHLIYDEWYRNKNVQRPLFAPIDPFDSFAREQYKVAHLPFSSFRDLKTIMDRWSFVENAPGDWSETMISDDLLDGSSVLSLHQRNYGDDYFTAARPSAQEGSPAVISTAGGSFTISALRVQNSMQEFREVNNYASPDYVQTMSARYGTAPSNGVAQKPILVGSADYPYFSRGVDQNSGAASDSGNPWTDSGVVGAQAGRASANGTEFICDFDVTEPGYFMVLASFVPEANYASGIAHDMNLFTQEGSLVDLPVGMLENVGDEPIERRELDSSQRGIFGYVQRYLWHKAGHGNEVHGLLRDRMSLAAYVPYRSFGYATSFETVDISSQFLRIKTSDLDGITAVKADLSKYGLIIDVNNEIFVSEPLSESALPSLVDPAREHGRDVYLKHGGSRLD